MKRQTILLALVGILVAIKFGIMPLRDSIKENAEIIASLEKRVGKGEALIATKDSLKEQELKLDRYLGDSKANFPVVEVPEVTQLQFQRIIRTKADKFGVTIESQEWTRYEEGTPAAAYFQIRVSSNLEDYPGFLMEVENVGGWVSLHELNLDVSNQRLGHKRLGITTGRLIFKINYIVEETNVEV